MRTRQAKHAFFCEHFHLKALPRLYHEDVITAVCDVLLESNMPKSEFCRLIFLDPRLAFFTEFSQTQIAEFLELLGPSSVGAKPKPKKTERPKRAAKLGALHFCPRERADHSGLVETASYHSRLANTSRSERANGSRVGANRR
jgi:hypothetical protein